MNIPYKGQWPIDQWNQNYKQYKWFQQNLNEDIIDELMIIDKYQYLLFLLEAIVSIIIIIYHYHLYCLFIILIVTFVFLLLLSLLNFIIRLFYVYSWHDQSMLLMICIVLFIISSISIQSNINQFAGILWTLLYSFGNQLYSLYIAIIGLLLVYGCYCYPSMNQWTKGQNCLLLSVILFYVDHYLLQDEFRFYPNQ